MEGDGFAIYDAVEKWGYVPHFFLPLFHYVLFLCFMKFENMYVYAPLKN